MARLTRASTPPARRPALAVALTCLVAAGCVPLPAARLRLAGETTTRIGSANDFVPYDQPLSKGSIMLCLTEPATAILTDVAIGGGKGNVKVDAFALRPRTSDDPAPPLGDEMGPLAANPGFEPGGTQEITAVCGDSSDPGGLQAVELGLQLSWGAGEVAGGPQIELTYLVDGRTVHSSIPWEIWLCRQRCPDDVFVN